MDMKPRALDDKAQFFYRTLGTRALRDLVERLTDHIDCNLERTPEAVAIADENRALRSFVQEILTSRGVSG